MRLVLVGFGHVGRAFARLLIELGERGGSEGAYRVVAILDSRSCLADAAGLDLLRVVKAKERTGRLGGGPAFDGGLDRVLERVPCDVVVEMSISGLSDGEPGTRHLLAAIRARVDVITSNKGPFALHYGDIAREVRTHGRQLRFGTTVGGPLPILELMVDHLPPGEALGVRGIANGTTQFLLDRVGRGASFEGALREAQRKGVAEADPTRDLDGWDAAWKAAIIHNCLFSPPIDASEIDRDVVRPSTVDRARDAVRAGKTLVSLVEIRPGHASVRLREMPGDSPWALPETSNVFEVETKNSGRMLLHGPGAGPVETASGLLADLLSLGAHASPRTSANPPIRWPPVPPHHRPRSRKRRTPRAAARAPRKPR